MEAGLTDHVWTIEEMLDKVISYHGYRGEPAYDLRFILQFAYSVTHYILHMNMHGYMLSYTDHCIISIYLH